MQNKKILRKNAKEIRKKLNIPKLSISIVKIIQELDEFKKANHILIYSSFNNEIDLEYLIDEKKNFYLPKVNEDKKTLSIFLYKKGDILIKNSWGIKEPDEKSSKQIFAEQLDMVIVPALMCDKKGYRLGYGGGFYDRLLPALSKNCIKIIPVASSLICEQLPIEEHDCCADFIITEKEIFQIKS